MISSWKRGAIALVFGVLWSGCSFNYTVQNSVEGIKKTDKGNRVVVEKTTGETISDRYVGISPGQDTLLLEEHSIAIKDIKKMDRLELTDNQIIGNIVSSICLTLLFFLLVALGGA